MKVNNKLSILKILKENSDFTSGEFISRELNISRTAVWKNIKSLSELGYNIIKDPKGYKIILENDLLLPYEFNEEHDLYIYRESTASTMSIARNLITKGNFKPWSIIVSESQSSGRSKDGTPFSSPLGGLYFTIIVDTKLGLNSINIFPMVALIVLHRELSYFLGNNLQVKWPFELWLDNKKIGGILHDFEIESNKITWLTLGIGVNISVPRRELLIKIKDRLIKSLNNPNKIFNDYKDIINLIGKSSTFIMNGKNYKGIVKNIDRLGTITLITSSGEEFIYIGDSSLEEKYEN